MPTYQQGMTYTNQGGNIIPIVSQQDLDNLASIGISPNTPSNVYDTSNMGSSINVPTPATSQTPNYLNTLYNSIGSTQNGLTNFLNQFSQETKPVEQERSTLTSRLNTAIDKLVGRGKRTQELMTEQKLPQSYEQLKNLNTQIAEKQAAYNTSLQKIEGQPIATPFITGQQAQVQKMQAIEMGNMATLAQALQGNIELSRQMINDTVNLEYADTEQEIENLKFQLEMNTDNMTQAEKKRAEQLNLFLTQRQEQITAEKEEKTNIRNLALKAVENGMPTETAQRMMSSKTMEEAMALGGKFLQNKASTQLVESNGRQLLINTQTGETIKDLGAVTENNKYQMTTDPITGQPIVFNTKTGQVTTTDLSAGIVDGYNISTYATDPNHEKAVASILDSIGKLETPEQIDSYIKSVAPNSKITSQMIQNTSQKYGVSWEMLIAMMQQDSNLGTAGLGAKNNNPGNIGQFDSLGTNAVKGYKTLQEGVDAVGNWLAKHKVTTGNTNAEKIAQDIFSGSSSLDIKSLPTAMRTAVDKELTRLRDEAKYSGDTEGIIKASAGGKDVDASFITSFDKAINVVYQIDDLQNTFNNENLPKDYVKQQKNSTGVDLNPIWGKVRKMNPWDKDAQTIKAQLQAIVPNLARGIYGEVGVLTDNDIKNYSQTLPTLTSTEQVRKAVLGITIKSVQRAIENKLKSQASAGRDVSGYLGMYKEVGSVADRLLSESGMSPTNTSGNLSDEEAYQQYLQIIGQ